MDEMLVSVVFHHHQPWYIDRDGCFQFSWLFDNARNYMRHLETITGNEHYRATYNLSPTLLRQWQVAASGRYSVAPGIGDVDVDEQAETSASLLRGYREANGSNIEIVSQPYYHPIMPLLARHGLADDLDWQLKAGMEETAGYTGRKVAGMWSPECAFSSDAAAAAGKAGFGYTVLDGSALPAGEGGGIPFKLEGGPLLFFRDNEISNAFSFSWPMQKPEVMERELLSMLADRRRRGLRCVVIALDGENWMNGADHLSALCRALAGSSGVRAATLGEASREVESGRLGHIGETSWAQDHSFSTWEGSEAKNSMWRLIDGARDAIASPGPGADIEKARGYLRIAEGSDYTYWDFDRPGRLTQFGMGYAAAAREAALGRGLSG